VTKRNSERRKTGRDCEKEKAWEREGPKKEEKGEKGKRVERKVYLGRDIYLLIHVHHPFTTAYFKCFEKKRKNFKETFSC
jgi:hypothetical protein